MPTATTHHPESDSDSEFEDDEEQSNEDYARIGSPDSIEELEANEFPSYFSERNARLFHSSPTAPYPLPVDAGEQEVRLFLCFYQFFGPIFSPPAIECPERLTQRYEWRQLSYRWPCGADAGARS